MRSTRPHIRQSIRCVHNDLPIKMCEKCKKLFLVIIVLSGSIRHSSAYPADAAMPTLYSCSYEILDSRTQSWKTSNGLYSGTITRLNCVTDAPSTTIIRRLESSVELTPLNRTEHHVFYYFGEITCDDMGTYVCDDGRNHTKSVDLGILNCKPHLCNSTVNQTKIIVSRNQPIFLCVVSYPAITDVEIVNQRNGKAMEIGWTQIVNPRKEFYMYTLNITLTSRSTMRPGQNSLFDVIVLHTTEPKKHILDVTLELTHIDENPANVTIQTITTSSTTPPDVSDGRLREDGDSPGVNVAVAVIIPIIVVMLVVVLYLTKGKWLPKLRQLQHNPGPVQENHGEPGVTDKLTG